MTIVFEAWDIRRALIAAIRASDDEIIQRAIKTNGIVFNDFSASIDILKKPLKAENIKPSEVTEKISELLKTLSAQSVDAIYHHRKFGIGPTNTNGDATVYYEMDEKAISRAFINSTNPVIKKLVEDRRIGMERFAEEEKKRTAKEDAEARIREEERKERQAKRDRYKGEPLTQDSLNPHALCVTHATKHMPKHSDDGSVEITTTSQVTGNAFPRNTNHFALNHKVNSVGLYGDWSDASILIIAPFDKMCEANGAPAALNTVDSYWTSGLNKSLRIPHATLVIPGDVKSGLYKLSLTETHYKTQNFSNADIEQIRHELPRDDKMEFEAALSKAGNDTDKKTKLLAAHASQIAAAATMDYLGYEVKPGGMWAWGGSWDVTDKTKKLASDMKTICCAHTHSPHGELEDTAHRVIQAIEFMTQAIEHPEPPMQYHNGCYEIPNHNPKIPSTALFLEDMTYIRIMGGDYFPKMLQRIEDDLKKTDAKTHEVFKDWLAKITPAIERIDKYAMESQKANATTWRNGEYAKDTSPARGFRL